jgi:hypothetical protein
MPNKLTEHHGKSSERYSVYVVLSRRVSYGRFGILLEADVTITTPHKTYDWSFQ